MKLISATFENFRLLRDLELQFSNEPEKKLTVIRAANESGKTTILHGLQWALYGDSALPDKGAGFRLHPIDWDESDETRVPITATVDFELSEYRRVSGGIRESRQRYRLVRSAYEEVDTASRRSPATIKLFAIDDTGSTLVEAPESLITEELPAELRDVFFTDGDRALSFIEADVAKSTKRERVQRAIRSLLGLGVIEDGIKHVRKTATEVNRKAKGVGNGGDLKATASRLDEIEVEATKLEDELEDAKQQFVTFDEKAEGVHREIVAALRKGDKNRLSKELEKTKRDRKEFEQHIMAARKEHAALFRGQAVAIDLLAPVLDRAYSELEALHDQGKIPNTTIPVLEERLSSEICICGESLKEGESDGKKRRAHIKKLIADSERADEIQVIITDLYYGAKPLRRTNDDGRNDWRDDYRKVVERRDSFDDLSEEAGRRQRGLEKELDALPDIDIQGLRETERQFKDQRDRHLSKQSECRTKLSALRRERDKLAADRDRLLREQKKGARVLAELEVTKDVMKVLKNAYERITEEELRRVSDLMNDIFLEMIGADPEQGAIIKKAEISAEFDIIVYGPKKRTLNPDRDLNGASRRALTLAFILALTKVSEVEAPNVIDTPLGMTSGYVKRSILKVAIRESSQLILFLTPDEISGCEDIIDEAAGVVFTLTNPAHYPKMLVNDPGVEERTVLRCECGHRTECNLCERRADAENQLRIAS